MKMKRRASIIALLLVAVMVIGIIPAKSVYADGDGVEITASPNDAEEAPAAEDVTEEPPAAKNTIKTPENDNVGDGRTYTVDFGSGAFPIGEGEGQVTVYVKVDGSTATGTVANFPEDKEITLENFNNDTMAARVMSDPASGDNFGTELTVSNGTTTLSAHDPQCNLPDEFIFVIEPKQNGDNPGPDGDRLRVRLEGAAHVSGNTYRFTVDHGEDIYDLTLNGGEVEDCGDHFEWAVAGEGLQPASITIPNDFDTDELGIFLMGPDGYFEECTVSGTTASLPENIPEGCSLIVSDGGAGPGPGFDTDTEAIINLTGPEGSWSVIPMVGEDYDVNNQDGPCSAPYNKYAYVVGIGINCSQQTHHLNQYYKGINVDEYVSQRIGFNRQYDEDGNPTGFISMDFSSNWANRIESVTINGNPYDIPFNYDDRHTWLNAFGGQNISFTIDNIPEVLPEPVGNDLEGRQVYDVEIKVRPITPAECFIGNFLWNNSDDINDDRSIGHSRLTLLSVTYNDGTGTYTKTIDQLTDDEGREIYPFLHFREGIDEVTGVRDSEMVVPDGSWVTMMIEPEYGYQVKSFQLSEDNIKLGAMCIFSFRVGKGNFHIGAKVEKQTDDSRVNSDAILDANVILEEGVLDYGTARLEVDDAELSDDKVQAFDDYADANGVKLLGAFDISLSQVFFQGTGNDDDVWSLPMEDLKKTVYIALLLPDDIDLTNLYAVHNIHNGDSFELIPISVVLLSDIDPTYTGTKKVALIPTTSFSTFALATGPDDSSNKCIIKYDANGGTKGTEWEDFTEVKQGEDLVCPVYDLVKDFVTPPAGKKYAGFEVNGKVYKPGDKFVAEGETMTIKFLWEDATGSKSDGSNPSPSTTAKKTGDSSLPEMFLFLAIISLIGIAAVIKLRKNEA